MADYLKLFETHSQYEAYMGGEIALPNVSHCISENEVHYNPIHDYSKDYFTTIAKESGTITFKYTSGGTTEAFTSMSYKKNDGEWVTTQYDPNNGNTINVPVNSGDKVQWKGINSTFDYYDESTEDETYGSFTSDCHVDVEGNIMSLLYGDNFSDKRSLEGRDGAFAGLFSYDGNLQIISAENLVLPATTLAESCYTSMFYGCTGLVTAPKKLPATTLAMGCYGGMFKGCTGLTTAPELPATTLADSCYGAMFEGCTSLITAPELPATTLARGCYSNMFSGCTSLTTAPELPATTLAESCYYGMFNGCTSLTTAPELPATTLADYCYDGMFKGCTSLTTAPELPATTLANYCYGYMFSGCTSLTTALELHATTLAQECCVSMFARCTSLTTAPELPATTLVSNCYNSMFRNCSRLNYIKAMFTTTPSTSYTSNWVNGVASTGTFVKNSTAAWDVTGVNGVPTGWTVETASA